MEIKVKMGLILAIPPYGTGKNNGHKSAAIINNLYWMIQIEYSRWMKKCNKKSKTTNKTASIDTKEVNPEQNKLVAEIINSVQNAFLK